MENDWFTKICCALAANQKGRIWSDGEYIYCQDEAAAETVADLIECLYAMDGKLIQLATGFYDPTEDKRNGEQDRFTGWYYVAAD